MKHRFLITVLASVMLAGTFSTAIVPVQSISKKTAVNHGYRKVTLTKTVRIKKFMKEYLPIKAL